MSFSSEALVRGSFPAEAAVWPSFISVVMYFKVCPSVERVREVCQKVLFYSRFRSAAVFDKSESQSFMHKTESQFISFDFFQRLINGPSRKSLMRISILSATLFAQWK